MLVGKKVNCVRPPVDRCFRHATDDHCHSFPSSRQISNRPPMATDETTQHRRDVDRATCRRSKCLRRFPAQRRDKQAFRKSALEKTSTGSTWCHVCRCRSLRVGFSLQTPYTLHVAKLCPSRGRSRNSVESANSSPVGHQYGRVGCFKIQFSGLGSPTIKNLQPKIEF